MRDILFRGKRIDNGEWVEGYPCAGIGIDAGKWFLLAVGQDWLNSHIYQVDPATIGQYTGLTDKNGKKIFEGDLITIPESKRQGLPAPVKWSNFDACFEISRRAFNPICLDGDEGIYEVIGNIHDNPELLEGD